MSSPKAIWAGRVLGALGVLFLTFDTVIHILNPQVVIDTSVTLGLPEGLMVKLGILEAILLVLYLVPRTAFFGAVLWTGYLGGAILTNLRVGKPLFGYVLFPVYIAALLWGGLLLRRPEVRRIFPLLPTD